MSTEPSAPPSPEGQLASQWIGRVIEKYRIVEVLGEGGMGAVFVAEHLTLPKQFALKTIRAEFAGDGQAEDRFRREALATATIEHPHVVSAVDFGHLPEGGAFLVIQLVRGESLAKLLQRGPLHWRQVAELGAQIADALATCHAAGIIHRDLKPDNILLERRDDGSLHARVVDFGIARVSGDGPTGGAVADASQPITRMGAVIGTPGYMAPEQAVGQSIDHRVDLYALGVILWECSTGQRLWHGDTLTALFARQLAGAAPILREMLPGQVPDALSDLTAALIAPAPDQRPGAAAAIRDELRRIAFSGDPMLATGQDLRASSLNVGVAPTVAGWSGPATAATPGFSPGFSTPGGTLISGPPGPASWLLRVRALAIREPRLVRYGGAALAILALVLVGRCACGGDDPPAPPAPEPEVPAKSGSRKGRGESAPDKPATKAEPKADTPPRPDPPPSPPAADLGEIPEAYAEAAQTILTGTGGKARKKAAEKITGASDADKATIPEYLRNLAWFEKLARCEDKLPILVKIEESGDLRALPGLQTIAKLPKKSCGNWFNSRECLECLRVDLGRVIGRFEAEAAP